MSNTNNKFYNFRQYLTNSPRSVKKLDVKAMMGMERYWSIKTNVRMSQNRLKMLYLAGVLALDKGLRRGGSWQSSDGLKSEEARVRASQTT